jgi:hypothetical protein
MKTEKLFELLTLVGGIRSGRWEMVRQLVDAIAKGSVTIKEKEWNDSWKQSRPEYYPLDLAEIKTWSTFDDTCIELRFYNDTAKDNGHPNNQLVCEVKIYEGDSFSGFRKGLRFTALLWLPTKFLHTIEQRIEWAFEDYLEDAYKKHLEAQKKSWIDAMKAEILF